VICNIRAPDPEEILIDDAEEEDMQKSNDEANTDVK